MSWIEKIKQKITIVTGDGKSFNVQWKTASKIVGYNVSSFNFPNIDGTLVKRMAAKGNKYAIEFYFQGTNHLDESKAFENSSRNPGVWTLKHPLYGDLQVHPTELTFDNTQLNITKVSGNVLETIDNEFPDSDISAVDEIAQLKSDSDVQFASTMITPSADAVNKMGSIADNAEEIYSKNISSEDLAVLKSKMIDVTAGLNDAINKPINAIRTIQELINFPIMLVDSVENRVSTLIEMIVSLGDTLSDIANNENNLLYEICGASIITAMMKVVSLPQSNDYPNRNKVLEMSDIVTEQHNNYVNNINERQSDRADKSDSYVPNYNSYKLYDDCVITSISNMFDIAFKSKQERTEILMEKSNIILLAKKYYGLKIDDSTIQDFADQNNIGLNEVFELRKGRKVVYYV